MRFLDVHPMKGLDESLLKELQNAPVDEFGVRHLNILFNPEVDQCFCLIEAPTMEAVQKHHDFFFLLVVESMKLKQTFTKLGFLSTKDNRTLLLELEQ
jgi:hypothetical protein